MEDFAQIEKNSDTIEKHLQVDKHICTIRFLSDIFVNKIIYHFSF